MTTLHPIITTNQIRETYLRYLKTIYPFQELGLRDAFWNALQEPNRLVKGPLLEAAPPFAAGKKISRQQWNLPAVFLVSLLCGIHPMNSNRMWWKRLGFQVLD